MIEVRQTNEFRDWLKGLRDGNAIARIAERMRRLALGNPGHTNAVGQGVNELKVDYGPGYRVYFVWRGPVVVVLLCGGNKRTQKRDIRRAHELAKELENDQ